MDCNFTVRHGGRSAGKTAEALRLAMLPPLGMPGTPSYPVMLLPRLYDAARRQFQHEPELLQAFELNYRKIELNDGTS